MKPIFHHILIVLAVIIAAVLPARGFDTGIYAPSSVLSDGRWVKVSVRNTGLHLITISELRSWGFSDPSKVHIYGYGGKRIPDYFTESVYVDDLPQVQSELIGRGIVFYAEGPATDNIVSGSGYHYPTFNPYSDEGYYFLSDRDVEPRVIDTQGVAPSDVLVSEFIESVHYEKDLVSPAESGHVMVGEDFRFTPSRKFSFAMPGHVDGSDVWMRCCFYATSRGGLRLNFSANGAGVQEGAGDRVRSTQEWGDTCVIHKSFPVEGESLSLGISVSASGALSKAYLDNITINYRRRLTMPSSGILDFMTDGSPELSGATPDTRVWDVTDPLSISRLLTVSTSAGEAWGNEYYGRRRYAAWNENGSFMTVRRVKGTPECYDLHATSIPDMVIVTHPDLKTQSERIAALHRQKDGMEVLVVTPEGIYNEFSSGTPDVNAFRRMFKMFYDRGREGEERTLRYALFMGSVSFDHRRITEQWNRISVTSLPIWQTDQGLSESTSYCSDDYMGYLEDNSGLTAGSDVMSIAVGRIPARSVAEARTYTDRLEAYATAPMAGQWRNRVVLLADDEDNNEHMKQTEAMEQTMQSNVSGRGLMYNKVYLDAFEKQSGVVKAARDKLHALLQDGVVWWNYIGHAGLAALSNEGVMTLTDIGNLYLRKAPFFYGATCSFAQWDRTEQSGLEQLLMTDAGGVIGGISAVRPVYIARNGVLSKTLGYEIFDREESGLLRPVGEVLRRAKNNMPGDDNKMRYVLMGDPAMRLAVPDGVVTLSSVNGMDVSGAPDSDPVVIKALEATVLAGTVCDAKGMMRTDFNGWVDIALYDAERSVTTQGRGADDGFVFDENGDRLFAARAEVKDGKWECRMILPAEIADNFRNAAISMFAYSEDGMEAAGVNRDFYVYGYAEDAVPDDIPPTIEYMYLNHESFRSGDAVNVTPMLIARVADDTGLNMSLSGVGHQMSVRIDDSMTFSDLSTHFVPDADASPAGSIYYQLPELSSGNHTLTLKVWDIAGNSASGDLEFFVDPSQTPTIFDVYSDANPASVEANFYINHNRPDAMLTVSIDIYELGGRKVWGNSTRGRADMYASTPVTWDLTNSNGGRVSRGIYVYRATVVTEASGESPALSSSMAKRIAVAPL